MDPTKKQPAAADDGAITISRALLASLIAPGEPRTDAASHEAWASDVLHQLSLEIGDLSTLAGADDGCLSREQLADRLSRLSIRAGAAAKALSLLLKADRQVARPEPGLVLLKKSGA